MCDPGEGENKVHLYYYYSTQYQIYLRDSFYLREKGKKKILYYILLSLLNTK